MQTIRLEIDTPAWALPLLAPKRYKGAKGGRSSGKSHFFAELAVEEMVADPNLRFACIREVQRSLKFSAKTTIEAKIRKLGVSHLFVPLEREIRRVGGHGVMIFEGMQDHTADSIKSLEGFHRAWVEEAQSLSKRSLEILRPTFRADGSELWFSWNPENEEDAVDGFFRELAGEDFPLTSGSVEGEDYALVHVNYLDNPFVPSASLRDAKRDYAADPDMYEHVWLGGYNLRRLAQVFAGKWGVDEFDPDDTWDGPYYGLDFGFAQDPNAGVECWIKNNTLYLRRESYAVGLETDDMPARLKKDIPGIDGYTARADSARPETISYLKRHGMPKVTGVHKWPGSIEDGIEHLRQYDRIIIHPDCPNAATEFRLYSYKVDKRTQDVMRDVVDAYNNIPDAVRYALAPLIRQRTPAKRRRIPGSRSIPVY